MLNGVGDEFCFLFCDVFFVAGVIEAACELHFLQGLAAEIEVVAKLVLNVNLLLLPFEGLDCDA